MILILLGETEVDDVNPAPANVRVFVESAWKMLSCKRSHQQTQTPTCHLSPTTNLINTLLTLPKQCSLLSGDYTWHYNTVCRPGQQFLTFFLWFDETHNATTYAGTFVLRVLLPPSPRSLLLLVLHTQLLQTRSSRT